MQLAALLGFFAACGYGFGDYFGAIASRQLGAIYAAVYVHIVGLIAVVTWYVGFVGVLPEFRTAAALEVLGGSAAIALGGVSLYRAFEVGPVALVSPLAAVYPLVTALIGVAVFGMHLTVGQLLAVGLVVIGVVVSSDMQMGSVSDVRIGEGPALALMTSLLWGAGYALLDRSVDSSGWQAVILVQMCVVAVILGGVLAFTRPRQVLRMTPALLANRAAIGAGVIQVVADLSITLGLAYDVAAGAVVVSTSACYPVITMLLALRYFREEVRILPLIGALTAVAGVAVLVLSS